MRELLKQKAGQRMPKRVTVSVIAGFLLLGGLIIWGNSDNPGIKSHHASAGEPTDPGDDVVGVAWGAPENDQVKEPVLHSLTHDQRNGARVIRIQLVEGGDEMLLDAEPGRLIETRPAQAPTKTPVLPVMPPMGTKSSMG